MEIITINYKGEHALIHKDVADSMGLHSGEQITTEARFREILAVNNQYGLMLLEINKNAG